METHQLFEMADAALADCVSSGQALVRIPSPSGHEGAVAELVRNRMQALGYDRVWTDEAGNVIGVIRGNRPGKAVLFNCHLDQVDPGDPGGWPYPPHEGVVRDGYLWGRGASDCKGALAAQILSAGLLKRVGRDFAGEIYVAAVVLEEVGGLGTRCLVKEVHPDFVVIGEATDNQIARGHRGRMEWLVTVKGRSVHASVPDRGANPHFVLARFIQALEGVPMAQDAFLGPATVAPTLYCTDQSSANVIPGRCWLHLDWRNVPGQDETAIQMRLQSLLDDSLIPGCQASVALHELELVSYTGYRERSPFLHPPFVLEASHPLVTESQKALQGALGHTVKVGKWRFATDGGHTAAAGIPTIGFAPGEETFVHTNQDRISIAKMREALVGNMALALRLGAL